MKVWDKVRCIEWVWEYLTKWKIYTIIKINDQEFPRVIDDDWDDNWFSKDKFELVQEDKLPHELLWLDRYRVVKKDESDPLWGEFLRWFNTYYNVIIWTWNYYWYDWCSQWINWSDDITYFENNPTRITLAERDRIVNKKPSQTKKLSKPIRSCEHNWSIYKEDTIDWVSIEDMKATRDNINSKLQTHRNLFNKKK